MFVIYADLKVGGMAMMIYMGICGVTNSAVVRLYEMLYRYHREERILEDDAQ